MPTSSGRAERMSDYVIDYEGLAQDALRGVVRTVLTRIAKDGLPGEHHLYIAFDTRAAGVAISKRLREQYPDEMTIVLQHRFWDLKVHDTHFEVKLTFDDIPERLSIPFHAVKVFFDPSVPYGLQFEASELMASTAQKPPSISAVVTGQDETSGVPMIAEITSATQQDETSGAGGAEANDDTEEGEEESQTAEVVELDAFRKK